MQSWICKMNWHAIPFHMFSILSLWSAFKFISRFQGFSGKIIIPRVFCFCYSMNCTGVMAGDQAQGAIFKGLICGMWRHIQNPPEWPPMPNVSRVKSRQAPCQCLYWEWNSEWSFSCWCSERYTQGREIVLLVPLLYALHITSNLNKALHFATTIRKYTNYKGGLLLQLQ